ncbi:MAG: VWA domain-containing protein, partial [Candidatus Methanomethylophilaceae archaeon]|nr:VWA domain-containing protein [Candidatus Methanomethylophilaceae archaeon]
LKWSKQDKEISDKIVNARNILKDVNLTDPMLELIVNTCIDANVSGHRADIAMMNTSIAIAAYAGRKDVSENDVNEAAILVLKHRTKNPPKYEPSKKNNNKDDNENNSKDQNNKSKRDHREEAQKNNQNESKNNQNKSDSSATMQFKAGEEFKVKTTAINPVIKIDDIVRDSSGRRTETESTNGRYVSYKIPVEKPQSIALDATIRNAAMKQKNRSGDVSIIIEPEDIMEKIRVRKSENLIVFVVDASGSMGAEQRMTTVKGAILSLLTDAYQKRDKICLITFRGDESTIIVPPTNNIDFAKAQMKNIPTGGKTPLGDGLTVAYDLIKKEMNRDHKIKPIMVIISDGRGNSSISGINPQEEISYISTRIVKEKICSIVLDSESGFVVLGFAKRLADMLNAKYMKLDTIRSDLKGQLATL